MIALRPLPIVHVLDRACILADGATVWHCRRCRHRLLIKAGYSQFVVLRRGAWRVNHTFLTDEAWPSWPVQYTVPHLHEHDCVPFPPTEHTTLAAWGLMLVHTAQPPKQLN